MINNKKVHVIIQARVSSSRLPVKHFKKIGDKSVLEWILWRLSRVVEIDKVIISTCREPGSDLFRQYQGTYEYDVFQYDGDVNDVVGRHYACALTYLADYYVVISGDCPLVDPLFIKSSLYEVTSGSYLTFAVEEKCIHEGINIYSREAIHLINEKSVTAVQRENFGYSLRFPDFLIKKITISDKEKKQPYRISVDNTADLRFMNRLFEECLRRGKEFTIHTVVDILSQAPRLLKINDHVRQKSVTHKTLKFLFISEASPSVGLGHLSRMIGLAQELNECCHHNVQFLINNDSAGLEKLSVNGFDHQYTICDTKSLSDSMKCFEVDSIIIDLKGIDDSHPLVSNVRENNPDSFLVVYDSMPKTMLADMYLIQGIQPDTLSSEIANCPKVYSGLGTVFINKELEAEVLLATGIEKKGIFVSFGATDADNYWEQVHRSLPENESVYLRPGCYSVTNHVNRLKVVKERDLYRVMASAKKGLCSFGLTFYELLIAGAEVFCKARNRHDEQILEKLESMNYCHKIDDLEMIGQKIEQKRSAVAPNIYLEYAQARRQVIDALLEGVERRIAIRQA